MPPTLSIASAPLKCSLPLRPYQYHHHPPFLYGKPIKPSSDPLTIQRPRAAAASVGVASRAARFAGQGGWCAGLGSGRAGLAGQGSMGARRGGRRRVMGSLNGEYEEAGGSPAPAPTPRLLTLPTVLTLGRVAAVPLLVSTYHMSGWWGTTATTSIFLAAAFTDWLDGYLARKMRLGTAFGAFLDPVADKLMVAATLVLLCTKPLEVATYGELPWLLTIPAIAIIGREITMSAVREWAASQDSGVLEAVAVNSLGKWKTATQMTALTILLATRDPSLTGPGAIVALGILLLYVSSVLALWSLAVYMRKIWKVLLK